jgi:hypothetical protein
MRKGIRLAAIAAVTAAAVSVAMPATASEITNTTGPASGTTISQPANEMTSPERGALPASGFWFASTPGSASPSKASSSSVIPAAGTVDSTFNFANNTGGHIASFNAHLHFVSFTEFTLSDVNLLDTLCDNRSVFADVYNQDGFLGEFKNGNGCGSTAHWASETISYPDGTDFVYIALYACNTTSCSSVAYSLNHYNPHSNRN